MQSGYPIESQYERESRVELYVNRVIDRKYELNPTLSRLFSTFKDRRTVPYDITWEKMKREFGSYQIFVHRNNSLMILIQMVIKCL